jgi:hypothetical protein
MNQYDHQPTSISASSGWGCFPVARGASPLENNVPFHDLNDTALEWSRTGTAVVARLADGSFHSRLLDVSRALTVIGSAGLGLVITPVELSDNGSRQQLQVEFGREIICFPWDEADCGCSPKVSVMLEELVAVEVLLTREAQIYSEGTISFEVSVGSQLLATPFGAQPCMRINMIVINKSTVRINYLPSVIWLGESRE